MTVRELKPEEFFIYDNFPLVVARRDPQPVFPRHRHQFFELVIVTRGTAVHEINNVQFPITVGDVFILNDKYEHEFCDIKNLSLVNIIFDPVRLGVDNWMSDDLPGFKALLYLEPEYRYAHRFQSRLRIFGKDFQKALDLVDELDAELLKAEPGFKLVASTIFMHLLYQLARCYSHSEAPQSMILLRIANAMNYLDKHFQEEVRFEKLAKIANMSMRNFQRTFQKAMGCSARDHLLNLRLQHAAKLMENPGTQISEIAFAAGFTDSNYFTKQFKKKFKTTPRAFRRGQESE